LEKERKHQHYLILSRPFGFCPASSRLLQEYYTTVVIFIWNGHADALDVEQFMGMARGGPWVSPFFAMMC
jgi:hypothetical protein